MNAPKVRNRWAYEVGRAVAGTLVVVGVVFIAAAFLIGIAVLVQYTGQTVAATFGQPWAFLAAALVCAVCFGMILGTFNWWKSRRS